MLLRRNIAGQTVEIGPLETTGIVPLTATPYVNDILGAGTIVSTNGKCWKYTFTQAETDAPLIRLRLEQGAFAMAVTFATLILTPEGTVDQVEKVVDVIGSIPGIVSSGSETVTLTIKDTSGTVIPGADVFITSDSAGLTNVITGLTSNNEGKIVCKLDPGTFYVWCSHRNYTFTNPQTIVVTDA